jgi:hypothetical protein
MGLVVIENYWVFTSRNHTPFIIFIKIVKIIGIKNITDNLSRDGYRISS